MEMPAWVEVLRFYMQREGFTVDQLAKASGVDRQTLFHWRKGRVKRPREWHQLLLVAAALNLADNDTSQLLQAANHPALDDIRPLLVEQLAQPTPLSNFERRLLKRFTVSNAERFVQHAPTLFASMPLHVVPPVAPLPRGARMPLPPNPLFVGRQADLLALATTLAGSTTVALVAATGMGGIGKTQLAGEFVHRYGQFFAGGVFWLSFADPAAVPAEIAACGAAEYLALRPAWDTLAIHERVRLVQAAWQAPVPRLLIFDNCEDETLLHQWRPTTGGCRVLITSRRAHWDTALNVHTQPLAPLLRADSVSLLQRFVPQHNGAATLDAIAAQVGDLPLALHMAGRYLQHYEYAVSPQAYLAELDAALLEHRSLQGGGYSPTGHDQHLARAFALSYDRLDPHHPTDSIALALLARAAYFAPGEPIERALLRSTLDAPAHDLLFHDALARLLALGLVEQAVGGAVRMHRLVIAFVQQRQRDDAALAAVEQHLINVMNQYNEQSDVQVLIRLHPHLFFVAEQVARRSDMRAAAVCESFGYHLWLIAHYSAAQPYLERALAIRRSQAVPDQEGMALAYNRLALLHVVQERFDTAQSLFHQALAIWLDTVGACHPHTVATLNNLGNLHVLRGNYATAQHYLAQALTASRQLFGLHHAQTARIIHNAGYLCIKQGRYRRAQWYLTLALRLREHLLPALHVSTAATLEFLAEALLHQHQHEAAQQYVQRTHAMRLALFGDTHPMTAGSQYLLGWLLHAQGKLDQARTQLEQALQIYDSLTNAEGHGMLFTLTALGDVQAEQGRSAEARAYLERAIVGWEQIHGHDYPELVHPLTSLGRLLARGGDTDGALNYLQRALHIGETKLGTAHPWTANVRAQLAALEWNGEPTHTTLEAAVGDATIDQARS